MNNEGPKSITIPASFSLPEGYEMPPGKIELLPPDECHAIYAKVLEYRRAYAEAQDVRVFKMQLFDEATKLKKELWKLIEGKK